MNVASLLVVPILLSLGVLGQPAAQAPSAPTSNFTFDKDAAGKLPEGWKAEGTNQKGPVATWEISEDKSAPSSPNVLALRTTNHTSGGTFNLCWTDKTRFQDGTIEVKFKAVSGKEDQGGGLVWRVKDRDNYMIARMNPLEDNFRVYYVAGGSRHQLDSASVKIEAGTWHTIRVEQYGDHVVCSLDGKLYLNARDDHVRAEGGVGLWTKADAVSSFDDLKIQPAKAGDDKNPGPAKPGEKGKDPSKKDKGDDDDDDKK